MARKYNLRRGLKKWYDKLFPPRRTASAATSTTPSIKCQPVVQEDLTNETETSSVTNSKSHGLPSRPSPDPQIDRLSIEPRLADFQAASTSQVACLAISSERLDQAEPLPRPNPTVSVSQEIWNTAYDDLEATEGELVRSYVKILKKVLGGESGEPSTPDLVAEMMDPLQRQKTMRELIQNGQRRISNVSNMTTKVGEIADYILKSRGIVNLALQSVPQAAPAALPWAGVCLGLEILRNPAQATKSNLDGIAHVISRMDWYCALTELLLNNHNMSKGNDFQAVFCHVKKRIIELYKALLLYQIKSVCSYYRNLSKQFLRDIVDLDDWEGDINLIKDIESTFRSDVYQYYQENTKASLGKLVNHASKLTKLLGDVQQDIRNLISQQKAASRDKIDSECRKALRVVDPEDDMKRIEGDKEELLNDAYMWIFDTPEYAAFSKWENENDGAESLQRQVFWLKGHAGTGKTMLMIGLIRRLSHQSAALAPGLSFFFCQGTDAKLSNATAVLRSLMWLLLFQQPYLISHLLQRYNDSGPAVFTDQNSYYAVSEMFQNMLKDTRLSPVYFAVDALDECLEDRAGLVKLISTTLTLSKKVKWLLSSRPEVDLAAELKIDNTLVELDTQRLEGPVKAYIDHKLKVLGGKKDYNDVILKQISDKVHQRAGNTFLWVALVFKTLGEKHGAYAVDLISKMPPGLSALYQHMITRIEKSGRVELEDCKKVLKAAFIAFRPLCISELSLVTGLDSNFTEDVVQECGSFVTITGKTVNLIHQSAKDFLQNNYATVLDPAGVARGHFHILERSFKAIASLERNMYKLDLGAKPEDMESPIPDPLAPLRYSCVFWVDHMCSLDDKKADYLKTGRAQLLVFLKTSFLRWLESLSLLEKLDDGLLSMQKLAHLLQLQPDVDPNLVEFLSDAIKFFLRHRSLIELAPLQTYGSALVFSPITSRVRNQFWDQRLPLAEIILGAEDDWGASQQTLEEHSDWVSAVAFSPDSKTLASTSRDTTIWLWDAATGTRRQRLRGHDHRVWAIAFSPDGKTLASASQDKTIGLWDATTGVFQQVLVGHRNGVCAVAFSLDCKTLASASDDRTVRLWDVSTGVHKQTLRGHNDCVSAVAFSFDGITLASASYDKTIRLWDATTGICRQELSRHDSGIYAVAFSPDHKTLASSSNKIIQLWDAATGVYQRTLEGHSSQITRVAFSPDGRLLASASYDRTVRLWDITATSLNSQRLEGHKQLVTGVAFSPNGRLLASASADHTVRLWDVTGTSQDNEKLEKHSNFVQRVLFSPDGKLLASSSLDKTIRIWDTTAPLPNCKRLEGHTRNINDIEFSPDSRLLASASLDCTVRLWDITATSPDGKIPGSVLVGDGESGSNYGEVCYVMFSDDGTTLTSFCKDNTVQNWNLRSRKECQKSTGKKYQGFEVKFGSHFAGSAFTMERHCSWIALNGKNLLWLPLDCRPRDFMQVAISGSMFAVGGPTGKVVIIRFL